jgi:mono/diheme cytochrome c family protein
MRKILKWTGITIGGLVAVALLAGTGMYAVGSSRVERTYDVAVTNLTVPTDGEATARGAHLVKIYGCVDCHTADLGGMVMTDEPPFRVVATNLTAGAGGIGAAYSDADFDRAIRHGVRPTGKGLVVMPSSAYHNMSDEEAAVLIGYLRTVPPVDRVLPPTQVRVAGRILAAGPIDAAAEIRTGASRRDPTPERAATVEYGAYLAAVTCGHCHGDDMRGNPRPPKPGSPPVPDLTGSGQWSLEQFTRTLRTGVRPGGGVMDPENMPWAITAAMEDVELEALHAYLNTLAAQPRS